MTREQADKVAASLNTYTLWYQVVKVEREPGVWVVELK